MANISNINGFFIIDSGGDATFSGNVGIGVTADASVRNFIKGSDDSTNNYQILTRNSSDANILAVRNDGKVGIGTSSPDRLLDVSGIGNVYAKIQSTNSSAAGIELDTNGGSIENWLIQADEGIDGLAFYDLGRAAYRMVIDSSGNVGIGTTSPGRGLTIDRTNEYAALEIIKNNTGNQIAYLGTGSSAGTDHGILQLKHGGVTLVQLYTTGDSYLNGGNVGIGLTAPTGRLHIEPVGNTTVGIKIEGSSLSSVENILSWNNQAAGTGWYHLVAQSSGGNAIIIYGNGNIQNANNSYGQISDINLKENITDATPKLEDIKKLKVKNFNFKGDDLKQIGMIAQDVEEVFPGLVEEVTDPKTKEKSKSLKYSVFVPMLIKSIQELEARVKELENK